MSIIFISHKYPPAIGGMEKQSFELINGFKRVSFCHQLIYDGNENFMLWIFKLRSRIKKIILKNAEVDTIHLNDGLMATIFLLLVGKPLGVKIFVTFHGLDVTFPFWIYQKVILNKLKKYDGFICISRATKQACLDRGFEQYKLSVIANGVSIDQKNESNDEEESNFDNILKKNGISPKDQKLLVCIGRPVKRKGFVWFAKEVLPHLPHDYRLVHVGNSSYKKSYLKHFMPEGWSTLVDLLLGTPSDAIGLRILSEDKALDNPLILLGQVSNGLKNYLIKNSHAVIIPNIRVKGDMEGFGLVALEAAILGARVLAADLEGLQDAIVNGKNGLLLKSEDANIWKNAITVLENQTACDAEQIISFTKSNYSWKQMVINYKNTFNENSL